MLTAPVSLQWPKTVKKIKDSCIKSAHLPFVSESCNILTIILETLDALHLIWRTLEPLKQPNGYGLFSSWNFIKEEA